MGRSERIRADLHKSWRAHPNKYDFRQYLSNTKAGEVWDRFERTGLGLKGVSEDEHGNIEQTHIVDVPITSKEQAIDYFDVDTDIFYVKNYITNFWGSKLNPNFQVKLWLERKNQSLEEFYELLETQLKDPPPLPKIEGSKIGVVATADYHIGADITKITRTPDFNVHILTEKLRLAAQAVNDMGYEEVHLMMAGDFIESTTGLNHPSTWKSLKQYGAKAIILAYEIIRDNYISLINNVASVNIVSGNHDRFSVDAKLDNEGGVAELIAYMLEKDYPDVDFHFDTIIVVRKIDGIMYLLTHGHNSLSKADTAKLILDYGDNSIYNISIQGHWHTRLVKKANKITFKSNTTVELDEMMYRKVTCPSLFTGNYYSESLGLAGTSGELIMHNNGSGLPVVLDMPI
jgi:predicted phosphodiesterase